MKGAAEVFLMWYGFRVEVVNVLEDPALSAEYAESVPVAFIDGKLACKVRMEPARFARMLEEAGARKPRD
jgi:predicted thioredoxin/glutaredoxin